MRSIYRSTLPLDFALIINLLGVTGINDNNYVYVRMIVHIKLHVASLCIITDYGHVYTCLGC